MKTTAGDVIICHRPGISVRLVAVVRNDGEEPWDIKHWRPEGRLSAEEIARVTVGNTGGRVLLWNVDGAVLTRVDDDSSG